MRDTTICGVTFQGGLEASYVFTFYYGPKGLIF